MAERVNLSELARRLGHNKGYIHRLKVRGVLSFADDGRIDEAEARAAIAAASDPSREYMRDVNAEQRRRHRPTAVSGETIEPGVRMPGIAAPESSNSSYHRAKAAVTAIDARIKKLTLDEMERRLVRADLVRQEQITVARRVRDMVMAVPGQICHVLAAESDPARVLIKLESELGAALRMIGQQLEGDTEGPGS